MAIKQNEIALKRYVLDYPSEGFVFDLEKRYFYRPLTPWIKFDEKRILNDYVEDYNLEVDYAKDV